MVDLTRNGANPLSEEHLVRINNALAALDEADAQIALAEQAGFDVTQQREQANQQRATFLRVKQVYFPNR